MLAMLRSGISRRRISFSLIAESDTLIAALAGER
jgi:hypothetical protein